LAFWCERCCHLMFYFKGVPVSKLLRYDKLPVSLILTAAALKRHTNKLHNVGCCKLCIAICLLIGSSLNTSVYIKCKCLCSSSVCHLLIVDHLASPELSHQLAIKGFKVANSSLAALAASLAWHTREHYWNHGVGEQHQKYLAL
jgi:hypothetical protein